MAHINFAAMKRRSLIFLSLFMAPALWAQMTLNDCLVYARDHARQNIINRLEVRKAGIESRLAASSLMPNVSLSSNGNVSFGRNIDPETNTYDNKKTLYTGFSLQMSLPLFDGLVSVNNLKAARVARLRQVSSARIEEDLISLDVIRAFYNVSYCKAMVSQMEQQLERDSTDLLATERSEQMGLKSGADVAELRAIVANDEYELSNQRNLLSKAYLTLRGCMGMELTDEPLDLVESSGIEDNGLNTVHPRIAEAELALRQSAYSLRAAKGAFSPRISLNGGVSTSYYRLMGTSGVTPSFSSQWHDNMGQYLGFSVSIPIFTGLSAVNRLKRAHIDLEQNRTRLDQTRYEIEKETAEAALDLKAAADELTAASRRLDAEQIAFSAVRRKFELGGASAVDLYSSGARLATARANLEGKRIQRIICEITLGYYNGKKLIKE